jgi:hypothetical protein
VYLLPLLWRLCSQLLLTFSGDAGKKNRDQKWTWLGPALASELQLGPRVADDLNPAGVFG